VGGSSGAERARAAQNHVLITHYSNTRSLHAARRRGTPSATEPPRSASAGCLLGAPSKRQEARSLQLAAARAFAGTIRLCLVFGARHCRFLRAPRQQLSRSQLRKLYGPGNTHLSIAPTHPGERCNSARRDAHRLGGGRRASTAHNKLKKRPRPAIFDWAAFSPSPLVCRVARAWACRGSVSACSQERETMEGCESSTLLCLGAAELHTVCRLLSPEDVARLCCTTRELRVLCSDSALWRDICRLVWELTASTGPAGEDCDGFAHAYRAWHAQFGAYARLGIFLRGKNTLSTLRSFISTHLPPVAHSLLPGTSEAAVDILRAALQLPSVAPSLRLLWRLTAGQRLEGEGLFLGCLGGYAAYDHICNTRLLRLDEVVSATRQLRRRAVLAAGSTMVVVAASLTCNRLFFVDCVSAAVSVTTMTGETVAATPPGGEHALLSWLEHYVSCLSSGMFSVEEAVPGEPASRSISLFPRHEPLLSSAVTNSVRVQASVVFMPEVSDRRDVGRGDAFAYRIRFALLSLEEQQATWAGTAPFKPVHSVQLRGRHWIITDGTGHESEVQGEGVIGHFPLLTAGAEPFLYESMTYQQAGSRGSMRGSFTFVEGTLERPLSADFRAVCAPFTLEVPAFVH